MNMKRNPAFLTILAYLSAQPFLLSGQTLSTEPIQLPTGPLITPNAAPHSIYQTLNPGLTDLPNFIAGQPVTTALSPDGSQLLVVTSGYNLNGDATGKTVPSQSNEYVFVYDATVFPPKQRQVIQVPNTFVGLAWHPSGQEFYFSGGVDDKFYIYARSGSTYSQAAAIALNHKIGNGLLSNAPAPLNALAVPPAAAGIGVNQAGGLAIIANLFNDSISVIDLKARSLLSELELRPGAVDPAKSGVPGGEYPFWAVIKDDNKAYVSSVRDREIDVLALGNLPTVTARIPIQGQPNRMILNRTQDRLYVAVDNSDTIVTIDTGADKVIETFPVVAPRNLLPAGTVPKGANPNSLALSPDEKTLYVTEGGLNAVAVVNLTAAPGNRVAGLIPSGWYPTSVSVSAGIFMSPTRRASRARTVAIAGEIRRRPEFRIAPTSPTSTSSRSRKAACFRCPFRAPFNWRS
jgi:DNA-binding beta-propeller fold protein YncE